MNRKDIILLILNHLKTLENVLGVYEWLLKPLEPKQLPALVLRDTEDNVTSEGLRSNHALKIEIEIIVKSLEGSQIELRDISSNVLRVFKDIEDELNTKIDYLGNQFVFDYKEYVYGGARLDFIVNYCTPKWEQ